MLLEDFLSVDLDGESWGTNVSDLSRDFSKALTCWSDFDLRG
jgi:hypothetical protein